MNEEIGLRDLDERYMSRKETEAHFENINGKIDTVRNETNSKLDAVIDTLARVDVGVKLTNGRVNKLELAKAFADGGAIRTSKLLQSLLAIGTACFGAVIGVLATHMLG